MLETPYTYYDRLFFHQHKDALITECCRQNGAEISHQDIGDCWRLWLMRVVR